MADAEGNGNIRIDKWLWAARFWKTRSLASEAVAGGKVKLNGERVKAAKSVRVGDELSIRVGPYEYAVRVLALAGRRGPAAEAALLYEETVQSKSAREELAARLSVERTHDADERGRPTKKARRQIIRFTRGGD